MWESAIVYAGVTIATVGCALMVKPRRRLPGLTRARGLVIAVMNFAVTADGPDRSFVSTETRVFASSASARRRFAAYWRVIYPGSAIIRRMWLLAIERRATHAEIVRGIGGESTLAGR